MAEENENILLGIYIQLSRVYDMLMIIADGVGKGEEALEIRVLEVSTEKAEEYEDDFEDEEY